MAEITGEFFFKEQKRVKHISEVEQMAEDYYNSGKPISKIFIVLDKDGKFVDRIMAGPFLDLEFITLEE